MNLRQRVIASLYPVGLLVPPSLYRSRPIRSWPAITTLLYDIKVPAAERFIRQFGANINILFDLLDKTTSVPGDVAECGVFRGRTLVPMAVYLAQNSSPKHVLGFDSFEGFDEAVNVDVRLGGLRSKDRHVAAFNETSVKFVQAKLTRFGVRNTTLVKGFFRDTLEHHAERRFSFVHLDCDIYQSYKECLEFFYSRTSPGGIVLFDEYKDPHWPGATQAVDDFLRDKPEKPVLVTREHRQKFYIEKL
jgi:O-methyltransferase